MIQEYFTAQVTSAQLSEFSMWACKEPSSTQTPLKPGLIWLGGSGGKGRGGQRRVIVNVSSNLQMVHPGQAHRHFIGFDMPEKMHDAGHYRWLGFNESAVNACGFGWAAGRHGLSHDSILIALFRLGSTYLLCCRPMGMWKKQDPIDHMYPSGYIWYFQRQGITWQQGSQPPADMDMDWFNTDTWE